MNLTLDAWLGIGTLALLPLTVVAERRWLAIFCQRPEAHCVHHQRGLHRFNYSDLPLWDMLFGTFRNPLRWQGEAGFDPPADRRYGAMLAFADVNATALGRGSFGRGESRAMLHRDHDIH